MKIHLVAYQKLHRVLCNHSRGKYSSTTDPNLVTCLQCLKIHYDCSLDVAKSLVIGR
jgi:hypothetical protein